MQVQLHIDKKKDNNICETCVIFPVALIFALIFGWVTFLGSPSLPTHRMGAAESLQVTCSFVQYTTEGKPP